MEISTDGRVRGGVARYESVEGLARVLVGMLVAAVAVDVVAVVSSGMQLGTLRGEHDAVGAVPGLYRENSVGALALALAVATVPVFAFWIVRAHRNLPLLGAKNLDVTPEGAVGWFFVPFANLWKPYQAMRTLWRASQDASRWPLQDVPRWITLWWVAWIARHALGAAMTTQEPSASVVEAQLRWTELNITVQSVSMLLNGLAALLVLRVSRAQFAQFKSSEQVSSAAAPRPASPPRAV
jgi:hypothetical protein